MNKLPKQFISLIIRYAILVIVAIPNLWLFYFIFTPLTIYPVYFLLNLFFDAYLITTTILINDLFPIELIPACIAGSAYFLLLILNLATPNINTKKRLSMIAFSFLALLILNILRIFLLSLVFISQSVLFDIAHKFFWYIVSIVFVVAIWFIEIRIFKIKQIPFYSDIKFLFKNSILKK